MLQPFLVRAPRLAAASGAPALSRRSVAFVLVCGVLLAGCAPRETPVVAGFRTGTLHVGNAVEPQGLDPQLTTGAADKRVQLALLEGLLVQDPVTGQPAAGVAHSWTVSSDLLVYTFRLRPEARWSDGVPVTAADFVASAQRALSPKLGAEAGNHFIFLAGARAYLEGKSDFSSVGIRALDPHTLELRLEEPTPFLLTTIVYASWVPVPLHVLRAQGDPESRANPWTRPGKFVGNGPFVLKEWRPNQLIRVEKSPTYWDRERVRLEAIVFYPTEDIEAEERMFRTGQLHMTANLPNPRVAHWREKQPDAVRIEPTQRLMFLSVNPKRAPFTDARVRRALALSIERDALVRVLVGTPDPARSFAPADGGGFVPVAQFRDDVALAQRLLAEAGFPGGKGLPGVELLLPNRGENKQMAEVLQEMWRKHLGVNVSVVVQDWGVYIDSENSGRYQIAIDGWAMSHPYEFYDLHRSGNMMSRYHWTSATFDDLLVVARRAASDEARAAAYAQLEALLAQEMPLIPLFFPKQVFLLHPAVRGYHANLPNGHPWKYFSFAAPGDPVAQAARSAGR